MIVENKTQADFDLNQAIDLFDNALISNDERVVTALRQLLLIVALTASESGKSNINNRNTGPLRKLNSDVEHLKYQFSRLQEQIFTLGNRFPELLRDTQGGG